MRWVSLVLVCVAIAVSGGRSGHAANDGMSRDSGLDVFDLTSLKKKKTKKKERSIAARLN